MPDQDNLYAAPKARLEVFADEATALWRDGKVLVCRRDAEFPGRCVKCNDAAEGEPVRYKFTWHHAGWYVLVVLNILIYVVAAFIVRRRATLYVRLCRRHQRMRLIARVTGWSAAVMIAAGIVMIAGAHETWMAWADPALFMLPWGLALLMLFVSTLLSPQLRGIRIDKSVVKVRGCSRHFLDALPDYPE